jgi:hypothetical protein
MKSSALMLSLGKNEFWGGYLIGTGILAVVTNREFNFYSHQLKVYRNSNFTRNLQGSL